MSWVMKHSESKLADRLVLLVLASYASEDFSGAHPSIATICRDANLSERQVTRSLSQLRDSGQIKCQGATSNGVRIWEITQVANLSGRQFVGGANLAPGGCQSVTWGGANLAAPHLYRTETSFLSVIEAFFKRASITAPLPDPLGDLAFLAEPVADEADERAAIIIGALRSTQAYGLSHYWPRDGFRRLGERVSTLDGDLVSEEAIGMHHHYARRPFKPTGIPLNAATAWFANVREKARQSRGATEPRKAASGARLAARLAGGG